MEIGTWDSGPDLRGETMFLCTMGDLEPQMWNDLTELLVQGEMRWFLWLVPDNGSGGFR